MIDEFLNTVGRRLGERWVGLLGPPGVLFVAAVWSGRILGDSHALNIDRLVNRSADLVASWRGGSTVAVLAPIGLLVAATVSSLIASSAGGAVQRFWLASRPAWWVKLGVEGKLFRWSVASGRRNRWQAAELSLRSAQATLGEDTTELRLRRGRLAAARNSIALGPPRRPTWIGDRFRVVGERVESQYALDLTAVWPRLWLILPDSARDDIQGARAAFDSAAMRIGWSALYVALGVFMWWPGLIIGAALSINGWRSGRETTETLASLIEAAVDVYAGTLATRLDSHAPARALTPALGREITARLRKGA